MKGDSAIWQRRRACLSNIMIRRQDSLFFVPDREVWDHWFSEADIQRDIDLELLLDEIELFEVGELYEREN